MFTTKPPRDQSIEAPAAPRVIRITPRLLLNLFLLFCLLLAFTAVASAPWAISSWQQRAFQNLMYQADSIAQRYGDDAARSYLERQTK